MTKLIRIENADISQHEVLIEVYEKNEIGEEVLVQQQRLANPSDLTEVLLYPQRWVKVTEITK